jgi:hypothetical protein
MDLFFSKGFVIQSGSFAIATTDRDIFLSQLQQYIYINQGERTLSPGYGLVTQPQTATRSLGLVAERERLNVSNYLPGVKVTATGTGKRITLEFGSDDLNLGVSL